MPGLIHNFVLTLLRRGIIPNALKKAVEKEFVFRQKPTDKHVQKFDVTISEFQDEAVVVYGTPKDGDPILYFCHGGGFVTALFESYYDAIGPLYRELGFPIIAPDYPMPNETDVLSMRAWALAHFKTVRDEYPNSQIIVAGDSAGANMALRLAQELGDKAVSDIHALYILYGWLDLTREEKDYPNNKEEVLLDAMYMERVIDRFRGDLSKDDPRISPLFGEMSGLKSVPIRMISGDKDMLYAESLALEIRLDAEGHNYTHHTHKGYAHDIWLLPTPDGRKSLKEMAAMMRKDVAA